MAGAHAHVRGPVLGGVGGTYVGTLTGLNTSVQLHAPLGERSRILVLYTLVTLYLLSLRCW